MPFGVSSSPFLLAAVIQKHLEESKFPVSHEILDNVYVDNVLILNNSKEEPVSMYNKLKRVFLKAKKDLRGYNSNSQKANDVIPVKDRQSTEHAKILVIIFR